MTKPDLTVTITFAYSRSNDFSDWWTATATSDDVPLHAKAHHSNPDIAAATAFERFLKIKANFARERKPNHA